MVSARRQEYESLCERVRERGGTVRLSRGDDWEVAEDWGIMVTLPGGSDGPPHACGYLLGDLGELELVSPLLLRWLDCL